MKVYLIRHGETDWNIDGKLQGKVDIPLNEKGRKVAELTRDALKEIDFDVAFSSPLSRAYDTAKIILEDREIPIIKDERLIEIGFGAYEGVGRVDWDKNIKNFFYQTEEYVPKGDGERVEVLLDRELQFLRELFHNPKYQTSTILVTTHGAALSGIMTLIKGNSIAEFWTGGLHKNCGMSILNVENGVPMIEREAFVVYDEKSI